MKLTIKQLRYLIKEELKKVFSEQSEMPKKLSPKLKTEIYRMFDAGKKAAFDVTLDATASIDQAGEYVDETFETKFPNAYPWWDENYSTPDANEMLEAWKKARHSSRR